MTWAWLSLFWVGFADLYVRLCARGFGPIGGSSNGGLPEAVNYDVLVIGAGGAGLRAAIEASAEGAVGRARVQVAPRQGAHGHGRGRDRRGPGQRGRPRQLAGPLRRHHARRAIPQQLADGRAARQGGPGARPRAGSLGRAVRPDQGRPHPAAELRRPQVPAPRPRRRPDRAGDDPHAPGSRRAPRDRRSTWSARSPTC